MWDADSLSNEMEAAQLKWIRRRPNEEVTLSLIVIMATLYLIQMGPSWSDDAQKNASPKG